MTDIHEGGCVCGDVRYRIIGAPILATVCHCKFCQKRTGSAFSQSVVFEVEQVEFSGGPRTTYELYPMRAIAGCAWNSVPVAARQ